MIDKKEKRVYTEIMINAPAKLVWDAITDFESYSEWNNFTPRITLKNSDLKVGAELDLDCRMTDTELLIDEHEVILEIHPDKKSFCMGTSRTKGRPGIRSFRWQICETVSDTSTRYINHERYEGFLAPIVRLLYDKKLSAAMDKFCIDLKRHVENKFNDSNKNKTENLVASRS